MLFFSSICINNLHYYKQINQVIVPWKFVRNDIENYKFKVLFAECANVCVCRQRDMTLG